MENNRMNKKKLIYITVSVLFIAVLVSLFVTGLIAPDKEYSQTENRKLASFPEFSYSSVSDRSFMSGFEKYMSDRFFARDTLVSAKTFISRLLGETEINDVYVGKNGRLYEEPSEKDNERLEKTLNAINAFSEECDIENRYFMLIPNASYIIPENLPSFLVCTDQKEQIDGIYDSIDKNVSCIDAIKPLSEYEEKDKLFFYTDHHWTSEAAFCVFQEFSRELKLEEHKNGYENTVLSNSFSGTLASSSGIYEYSDVLNVILPDGIEGSFYVRNFETLEKSSSVLDMNKLETKNQYEVFFGGNYSRLAIYTDNLNDRNLLIFKDSYANCFIPLLIPHFEFIVIIDPRYFTDDINDILSDTEFSHLLYLYNVNTFLEDTVLSDCID